MSHGSAPRLPALRFVPWLALVLLAMTGIARTASADAMTIRLWSDRGNGGVYDPGDPITIGLSASHDANILVYEIDTEGAVHVLFPHEGSDTKVEGGTTLQLPQDPAEQLVVEGQLGEGYIVAIASVQPFQALPWYLRPPDANAEEMGTVGDVANDEGVTKDGKIVGDPFVAMERIRRQVLADSSNADGFATAYTSYYVHHAVKYQRYLCNDCHRPGNWSWWDGFDPYYSTCSVFDFRVNAQWYWGPTYWYGFVPYYAYVYRPNCPPRYRPVSGGGWCSSWDGWRRWTASWGGALHRTKTLPPPNYLGPSRYAAQPRGASQPSPPGFLASNHIVPRSPMMSPGSGSRAGSGAASRSGSVDSRSGWGPGSGIRREWRGVSVSDPSRTSRADGSVPVLRGDRQHWGDGGRGVYTRNPGDVPAGRTFERGGSRMTPGAQRGWGGRYADPPARAPDRTPSESAPPPRQGEGPRTQPTQWGQPSPGGRSAPAPSWRGTQSGGGWRSKGG